MTGKTTTSRKPTRAEMAFLLLFHATLSGAFLVAWLTGDEDTYGMHLFAGYTVLAALGARLAAALRAPAGSPLALPRPATSPTLAWLGRLVAGDRQALRARSPLYAWMAAVMLAFAAFVAVSGWTADRLPAVEELHETLAELTPAVIVAHLVMAAGLQWLSRWARRPGTAAGESKLAGAPYA
jgi:cytochrome b